MAQDATSARKRSVIHGAAIGVVGKVAARQDVLEGPLIGPTTHPGTGEETVRRSSAVLLRILPSGGKGVRAE